MLDIVIQIMALKTVLLELVSWCSTIGMSSLGLWKYWLIDICFTFLKLNSNGITSKRNLCFKLHLGLHLLSLPRPYSPPTLFQFILSLLTWHTFMKSCDVEQSTSSSLLLVSQSAARCSTLVADRSVDVSTAASFFMPSSCLLSVRATLDSQTPMTFYNFVIPWCE